VGKVQVELSARYAPRIPWVIEAAIEQALHDGTELLIEARSNQVNHRGGYKGMQPEEFRRLVCEIAGRKRFDESRLILVGVTWDRIHGNGNPPQRQ
jgi:tagatose-1,6-bisphosphate aldolase non-catalytic subunit AgaZ/GatZ